MLALKVVVFDQLDSVRGSVQKLVQCHSSWQVCAEAEEQTAILHLVQHCRPNLAVIDMQESVANALGTIRELAEKFPEFRILVTSVYVTRELAQQIRAVGGHGILEKVDLAKNLNHAIHAFRRGQTFFQILQE